VGPISEGKPDCAGAGDCSTTRARSPTSFQGAGWSSAWTPVVHRPKTIRPEHPAPRSLKRCSDPHRQLSVERLRAWVAPDRPTLQHFAMPWFGRSAREPPTDLRLPA
jgi:hypothetical protein